MQVLTVGRPVEGSDVGVMLVALVLEGEGGSVVDVDAVVVAANSEPLAIGAEADGLNPLFGFASSMNLAVQLSKSGVDIEMPIVEANADCSRGFVNRNRAGLLVRCGVR